MFQTSKKTWTPEEDSQLMELVNKIGASNWSAIATQLGSRTGKQCRERYHNHLQPNIRKGGWTVEEDKTIFTMQAKIGNQWAKIAKFLPGRTDNAVKNRWHAVIRAQQLAKGVDVSDVSADEESSVSAPKTQPIKSKPAIVIPSLQLSKLSTASQNPVRVVVPTLDLSRGSFSPSAVDAFSSDDDYMMMYHDHSHDHCYTSDSDCDDESVDSFDSQSVPLTHSMLAMAMSSARSLSVGDMMSARSEKAFKEVLGDLAKMDAAIDPSDLWVLAALSARSDLLEVDKSDLSLDDLSPWSRADDESPFSARQSFEEEESTDDDLDHEDSEGSEDSHGDDYNDNDNDNDNDNGNDDDIELVPWWEMDEQQQPPSQQSTMAMTMAMAMVDNGSDKESRHGQLSVSVESIINRKAGRSPRSPAMFFKRQRA